MLYGQWMTQLQQILFVGFFMNTDEGYVIIMSHFPVELADISFWLSDMNKASFTDP